MKSYRDSILLDQPVVTNYTLIGNGYVNIPMYWPEIGTTTSTFWSTEALTTKVVRFAATVYNIKFKILGSLDADHQFTETVVPETTLVVGTPYTKSIDDYYTALKIQVCPATLDQFGTFAATLSGSNLGDARGSALRGTDSVTGKPTDVIITGGSVNVTGTVTATVDKSSLATSAKQDTGNASLASIAKRYANNINLKIDFASVAEQTIIAAPSAGNRIVIQSIFMTCLVNNIVVIKSGTTEIGKAYVYGFSKDYISGLALGTAEAFKITATTADPIYGQVCYYVEAVP